MFHKQRLVEYVIVMQVSKSVKLLAIGGLALAAGALVTVVLLRGWRGADPLCRADKLIARCDSRIEEIEHSVPGLRSASEVPA
jgi:hypothetical protein